jgi:hypothetical protein
MVNRVGRHLLSGKLNQNSQIRAHANPNGKGKSGEDESETAIILQVTDLEKRVTTPAPS